MRKRPMSADALHLHRQAARRRSARTRGARRSRSSCPARCATLATATGTAWPRDTARRRRASTSHGSTFMPGEPMKWPTKVWRGRSNSSTGRAGLHHLAVDHHHHLVGEGQGLGLVVGDVDHRQADALVQLLQLAAQPPLQVRVDHRQRLVEQDRGDVGAHQAAAQRDLLLAVGGEAGGALRQRRLEVEHRRRSRARAARRRLAARRGCAAGRRGCRTRSSCRRRPGTGTPARCCARRARGG